MQVVDHLSQVRRSELGSVAFVPTMGALHSGHAALIHQGQKLAESVLVSIFVNPLQFDDPADLEKYPRTPQVDIQIAEKSGARVLWIPTYDEIYPGPIQRVDPGPVGALYEGAMRKGHFEGMLTVVKRLFDLVKPDWAFFGEKDFQQLFLIRRMVEELSLSIEIVAVPTVRQASGLAISSRNARLDSKDQQVALVISRALTNASRMGTIDAMRYQLDATLSSQPGFTCEYAVIIDESDFSSATDSTPRKRALIAGWINGVRLIDNMSMIGPTS
jgi:pantoate--beta-alanine ligase